MTNEKATTCTQNENQTKQISIQLPPDLVDDPRLRNAAKLLWLRLAKKAAYQGSETFHIRNADIAAMSRCSVRYLRILMRSLEAHGYLEKTDRVYKGRYCIYVLKQGSPIPEPQKQPEHPAQSSPTAAKSESAVHESERAESEKKKAVGPDIAVFKKPKRPYEKCAQSRAISKYRLKQEMDKLGFEESYSEFVIGAIPEYALGNQLNHLQYLKKQGQKFEDEMDWFATAVAKSFKIPEEVESWDDRLEREGWNALIARSNELKRLSEEKSRELRRTA